MSRIFSKVFKYKTEEFIFTIEISATAGLNSILMVKHSDGSSKYQQVYSFSAALLQETIQKAELGAKIWFDSCQTDQEDFKNHIKALGFTEN